MFNILVDLLLLVCLINLRIIFIKNFNLGQGIHEGAKQADVHKGGRPGLANKIMIIFTDGWQNKGPVSLSKLLLKISIQYRIQVKKQNWQKL